MLTDDETSLPSTFPGVTQGKPKALTHESSPDYDYETGWTNENWQAFAEQGQGRESSIRSDSFLKTTFEPGDTSPSSLIVKKRNTRGGKLIMKGRK